MSDLDPAVLRELLDEALVMLWTSGPDGRGTWVNRRWEEFTGAGYGDVTWADCVEPQDLARLRPRFQDALLAQRGYNMEYRMRRHDGVYRWVLATATPRFAEDGTFLGYLGSSVDITDRRESERQLREGSLAMRTLYEVIAQVDRPFGEQIEALTGAYRVFVAQNAAEALGPLDAASIDGAAQAAATALRDHLLQEARPQAPPPNRFSQ